MNDNGEKDRAGSSRLSETMRWALDHAADPSMASADWLATDIDRRYGTAVELILHEEADLTTLTAAKSAFKAMRIVGETAADRRVGARLYAATIAAALVHCNARISTQSESALDRAFRNLADDEFAPAPLRTLARAALGKLATPGGSA